MKHTKGDPTAEKLNDKALEALVAFGTYELLRRGQAHPIENPSKGYPDQSVVTHQRRSAARTGRRSIATVQAALVGFLAAELLPLPDADKPMANNILDLLIAAAVAAPAGAWTVRAVQSKRVGDRVLQQVARGIDGEVTALVGDGSAPSKEMVAEARRKGDLACLEFLEMAQADPELAISAKVDQTAPALSAFRVAVSIQLHDRSLRSEVEVGHTLDG